MGQDNRDESNVFVAETTREVQDMQISKLMFYKVAGKRWASRWTGSSCRALAYPLTPYSQVLLFTEISNCYKEGKGVGWFRVVIYRSRCHCRLLQSHWAGAPRTCFGL